MSKGILHTYRKRLINLTGNNRSLLLLRLLVDQMLDLHAFSFLTGGGGFPIIESLMARRSKKLCQVLDSRLEAGNVVSARLKRLHRFDRFVFEERGSNDLHVGWPMVTGRFSDGTAVRAPLIFFPVTLEIQNNDWVLLPREEAGISLNKAFVLAYAHYNKVALDDEFLNTTFDEFDTDSTSWRTQLYELLKDKIELNFNVETFRDELKAFEEYKKDEFDESQRDGELKLLPEAVLGIFPQASSQLVPDYDLLLGSEDFTDLETFFLSRNATLPGAAREERRFTPFDIDAWQEDILVKAKQGQSLVVQGPPGTGKSQLIANLIADAIATGRKTLLVCQKRAALDVVYSRLREIELADFLGLVHDFRNDRKNLYEKMARQIDRIEDFKTRNRAVDIIQAERRFLHLSRTIDHICEELGDFRKALFDESECGKSVKELYLSSNPDAPSISLKQEFQNFPYTSVEEFVTKLRRYAGYAKLFEADDYLWRVRKSFAAFGVMDMKKIIDTIEDIPRYAKSLAEKVMRIVPLNLNLDEYQAIVAREEDILGMISVLRNDSVYTAFQRICEESEEEANWLWLSNMERVVMSCFEEDGPEKSLPAQQLGALQLALKQRMDARRSLVRRIRWVFFSEHKYWIKRVLVANELPNNKHGFRTLERRLDNRLNLEHQLTALRARTWLADFPTDHRRVSFRKWFDRYKLAFRARTVLRSLREIRDATNPNAYNRIEFVDLFHDLLSILNDIPARKRQWLEYLTPQLIRLVNSQPALLTRMVDTLRFDFDNLCAYDKLRDGLGADEQRVIDKLHECAPDWDKGTMEEIFRNSLALTWIDYLETKFPVLRIVSSNRIDELQFELQQSINEKQRLGREILLVRAREGVYEEIAYNRLNNRVTYRDLHHQVTKKKKVWPLRRLLEEYQDEVFHLIPCWMASPESVSAIFPMTTLFDLVIFDEASQCFAERGLPAMFRGKQVVIAGDDKQLQPFELYQVRWEDSTEEIDAEVDSLLDLGKRYLSTAHLQGHYRSRAPELIDFSNRNFYNGRLRMLPDRFVLTDASPALTYEHVNGVWDNHTNQAEANCVVDMVMRALRADPSKEIGIVTFNAPQQMLIMDELESAAVRESVHIPSTLMVKNIENVQGDEKDIIIFSIGYAPDKKGKMIMQFGSLGVAGGENRLNVAITRARERVVVVTSIYPEQLEVEDSKNEGPRLLKEYLKYVHEVQKGGFAPSVKRSNGRPMKMLKELLSENCSDRFPMLKPHTQALPFSDVLITRDEVAVGLILTDDDRLHQCLSAKEYHAYSIGELNRKHWEYRFVFSRNYWLDRERTVSLLQRMAEA